MAPAYMVDPQPFARWLRLQLETHELTQAKAAQKLNLHPGTIPKLVSGSQLPDYSTLHAMAWLFGSLPPDLLGALGRDKEFPDGDAQWEASGGC